MNNFHIYEEVGRGKHSVVYKVIILIICFELILNGNFRDVRRKQSTM